MDIKHKFAPGELAGSKRKDTGGPSTGQGFNLVKETPKSAQPIGKTEVSTDGNGWTRVTSTKEPTTEKKMDLTISFGKESFTVPKPVTRGGSGNIGSKVVEVKLPCRLTGCEQRYQNIVIQGFPMKIRGEDELVGKLVEQFTLKMNITPTGKMEVILEEKGCFAVLIGIKELRTSAKSLSCRVELEEINIKPLLVGTLIEAEVADVIYGKTHMILGVIRGMEGSGEEVNLKLHVLERFVKANVTKKAGIVIANFLQPYGKGKTTKLKWLNMFSGYVLTPLLQGEELTRAYNALKIFARSARNDDHQSYGSFPRTISVGAFKFEVYQNLSKLYAARFGQEELLTSKRLIRLQGVTSEASTEDIEKAITADGLYELRDLEAIFGNRTGINHKEIFLSFRQEHPAKPVATDGELAKLAADGRSIQVQTVDCGPGTAMLREQKKKLVLEEGGTSPWISQFREPMGITILKTESPADSRPADLPSKSYLAALKRDDSNVTKQDLTPNKQRNPKGVPIKGDTEQGGRQGPPDSGNRVNDETASHTPGTDTAKILRMLNAMWEVVTETRDIVAHLVSAIGIGNPSTTPNNVSHTPDNLKDSSKQESDEESNVQMDIGGPPINIGMELSRNATRDLLDSGPLGNGDTPVIKLRALEAEDGTGVQRRQVTKTAEDDEGTLAVQDQNPEGMDEKLICLIEDEDEMGTRTVAIHPAPQPSATEGIDQVNLICSQLRADGRLEASQINVDLAKITVIQGNDSQHKLNLEEEMVWEDDEIEITHLTEISTVGKETADNLELGVAQLTQLSINKFGNKLAPKLLTGAMVIEIPDEREMDVAEAQEIEELRTMQVTEEFDTDHSSNPWGFVVERSDAQIQNPLTHEWCSGLGKGVFVRNGSTIPANTPILTFKGGIWKTYKEYTDQPKYTKGYGMQPPDSNVGDPIYDMYEARLNGDIASAVNSPAGVWEPQKGRYARANCTLTYCRRSKVFGLRTTRRVYQGEELWYHYGTTFQLVKMVGHREIIRYDKYVQAQLLMGAKELWLRLVRTEAFYDRHQLALYPSLDPATIYQFMQLGKPVHTADILRILRSSAYFTLSRDSSWAANEYNIGAGYCALAVLYSAHCRQTKTVEIKVVRNSGSNRPEYFKVLAEYLEEILKQETTKDSPDGEDLQRRLRSTRSALLRGAPQLDGKFWLSDWELTHVEQDIPKALWSGAMSNTGHIREHLQTDPQGDKDHREYLIGLSHVPQVQGRYSYEDLKYGLEKNTHIRYSGAHFAITPRQPSNCTLNRLMDLLANAIFLHLGGDGSRVIHDL